MADQDFGTRFDELVAHGYTDAQIAEILCEDYGGEETYEFLVALARIRADTPEDLRGR